MVTIHLFGAPQLLKDGQPVKVPRRKTRAVLYYLASEVKPVSRERLLNLFWLDTHRPAALQTLRTTLYDLRKILGAALISEEDWVTLARGTEVDAVEFERRLSPPPASSAELENVIGLYRGEFLEDFSLPDSPDFDDWALVERERYHRLAIRGLVSLASLYESEHNDSAALASLDRALAFDPLQEDLQREAIRLLAQSGDRPGAIRRYDQLRRMLDEEMGVPPMAETRRLYDAILNETLPPRPAAREPIPLATPIEPEEQVPFVGRADELASIAAMAEADQLIFVEGEPGIGKTRLIEAFAAQSGRLLVSGQARELEQGIPYQPVIEALRGLLMLPGWPDIEAAIRAKLPPVWLAEVTRLLPELGSASTRQRATAPDPAQESRLWEGMRQFLLTFSQQQPIILFLDDLHWADASTLALLGYLARQPSGAGLTLASASRPVQSRTPLSALNQGLIREDRIGHIRLGRLDDADIANIAHAAHPGSTSQLAAWLAQASEGNPYILIEMLRYAKEQHLAEGQLLRPEAPVAIPPSVYSLIRSRLDRLSGEAHRILDTAVSAGREFEFAVVQRASGLSETAALDGLDELLTSRLIHPSGTSSSRFHFDHTLTMQVAYQEVGEPRHRLLHRRVAEAVEALYRNRLDSAAGVLAFHFTEGNAPERAAPYAYRAGQRAVELAAWREAAGFFEQALSAPAGTPGAQSRIATLMALGDALQKSGDLPGAGEAFNEAADVAQAEGDRAAYDQAILAGGRALLLQAQFGEIIETARQVLEEGLPENAVYAERLWGTALSIQGEKLDEAARHLSAAETACKANPACDPVVLSGIEFELGSVAAQQGNLERAIELYRTSLDAARRAGDQDGFEQQALALNNLAYHLLLAGETSARSYAEEGLKLAEVKGFVGLLPYLLSTMGEIDLDQGHLDEARASFERGLDLALRLAMPERVAGLNANLGRLSARRGEHEEAVGYLKQAVQLADKIGTRHLAAQARIWLAEQVPLDDAIPYLIEARNIASGSGRGGLLENIDRIKADIEQKKRSG